MILDCAKKIELREISENICFVGVKFSRNIKYKIYIINIIIYFSFATYIKLVFFRQTPI